MLYFIALPISKTLQLKSANFVFEPYCGTILFFPQFFFSTPTDNTGAEIELKFFCTDIVYGFSNPSF